MRLFLIILAYHIIGCSILDKSPHVYNTKINSTKYFQSLSLFENKLVMKRRYGLGLMPYVDSGLYYVFGDTLVLIYKSGPKDKNWWPFTTDTLRGILYPMKLVFMTEMYKNDRINTMRRVYSRHRQKRILKIQGTWINNQLGNKY